KDKINKNMISLKTSVLILITFISLSLFEGILVFLSQVLSNYYFVGTGYERFVVFQILFALIAVVLLKFRYHIVHTVNAERDIVRRLLIDLLPVAPIGIISLYANEYLPVIAIIFVYFPTILYSVSCSMNDLRRFIKSVIVCTVVLIFGIKLVNIYFQVPFLRDFCLIFILNSIAVRLILFGIRASESLLPDAGIRGRNIFIVALTAYLLFISTYFFAVIYPKSRVPLKGMGFTPDWSPYDNRIVFTAFRVNKAFAFGEPQAKALIYNADKGQLEKLIPLPGIPSKEEFYGSLFSFVTSMVVWTWEKDRLFYLKNGKEGVLFNADGTGFETIFKLPKNQIAASSVMISPERTKIFFIAGERVLKIGTDMHKNFTLINHTEIIEHPYIVDLKKKTLTPFRIKGFRHDKDCSFFFRLGFSGWFSEDILWLDMPGCSQGCSGELFEKGAVLCGTEKMPDCPELKEPNSYTQIFVKTDGTCLGNFPKFEYEKSYMGDGRPFGDGKRFLYYANIEQEKLSCFYIGNLVDKTIVRTGCLPIPNAYLELQKVWLNWIRFNYQERAVYDADDWVWVRFYDVKSDLRMPRLINYKTGEFSPYFPALLTEPYHPFIGLPSPGGKFHVLGKEDTKDDATNNFTDYAKYKFLFDYAYFFYTPFLHLPSFMIFDIFDSEGKLIASISEKDFEI
ncbi:MAG: hypothetical protein AB1546_13295, partial [bacterium]